MEKTINANELKKFFEAKRLQDFLDSGEYLMSDYKGTKEEARERILKSGMLGVKL